MSLTGEINKVSGTIRKSIESIAKQGLTGADGFPKGTRKISGYVCAIHEDGKLAGTVDVQEFDYEPDEYSDPGVGHHEGVLLSAIQNNEKGMYIVPMLFSEVIIVQNPADGHEYVLMYSHAQKMKLVTDSLEGKNDGEIEIGVTEVEDFVETDAGLDKDFNELEPTKHKTRTKYTHKTITDRIVSPDDEEGYFEEKTVEGKTITVGNTKITIDGDNIHIETSSNITVKGKNVTITGGKLNTKGISSTDLQGPFNAIKVCPFSGAPHCGSSVSGT